MKTPGLVIAIAVWQFIDTALIALFSGFVVFFAAIFPSLYGTMSQQSQQDLLRGYDMATLRSSMWIGAAIVGIMSLCFLGVAFAGGIGLLKRKMWGRVLSIIHASVVTFIGAIMALVFFSMGGLMTSMGLDTSSAGVTAVFAVMGLISLVGVVLGILAIVYLARRKTGELFKPAVVQSESLPIMPLQPSAAQTSQSPDSPPQT